MMILIALTGGIGSGKSTTSAILQNEYGFRIIDCDAIVHALQAPNTPAVRAIARAFPGVVSADGVLDRKALGDLAFGDPAARKKLNAIMSHRIVFAILKAIAREWFRSLFSLKSQIVILDIPLLFERGFFTHIIAGSVLVACQRATQRARLMKRNGLTAEDADRRIDAQMSLEQKRALAGAVIENDAEGEAALRAEVGRAVAWMRRRSGWRVTGLIVGAVLAVCSAIAWVV